MTEQIDNVKKFVNNFMTNLLIPLANENVLDEEILLECSDVYSKELMSKESIADKVDITSTNQYKILHPFNMTDFDYMGKNWLSLEHFFQAAKYIGADDETEENIRTAKSAELAHRRGLTASKEKKTVRGNWEAKRDEEIEGAIRVVFDKNEDFRSMLRSTGKSTICYPHPIDGFLGFFPDNTGQNYYGVVLMKLRSELSK